jgi:hypothetical protein
MTVEIPATRNEPIVPTSPPAKRIKTNSTTMDSTSNGTAKQPQEQAPPLLIKKLSDKARLPTRGSAFAAGYDLYAARDTTIPARGKALVDTDISMSVPTGTCESTSFLIRTFCSIVEDTNEFGGKQTAASPLAPASPPSTSSTRALASLTPTTGGPSRSCCSTTARPTLR